MTMAALVRLRRSSTASAAVAVFLIIAQTCAYSIDCDADGTCEAARCDVIPDARHAVCAPPASLYGSGGTAMAYAPNQPESAVICDDDGAAAAGARTYRAAGWPFSRSTWPHAPKVQLKLNLLGCVNAKGDTCCCHALSEAEVEVWQARPDGTYSSLTGVGDCRARSQTRNGSVVFATLAPGSTGAMGGLGPGGWEFAPYGPPVLHILAKAAGHAATLVDVPLSVHARTLARGAFRGPDIRGAAWVRSSGSSRYSITSWAGFPGENRIEVEIDIYLLQTGPHPSSSTLCPSILYGHPSSFFLEPIAVCAPSMLDFFAL